MLGVHLNISAGPQEGESGHADSVAGREIGHLTYDPREELREGEKHCESAASCNVGCKEGGAGQAAMLVGDGGGREEQRHQGHLVQLAAGQQSKVLDGGPTIEHCSLSIILSSGVLLVRLDGQAAVGG